MSHLLGNRKCREHHNVVNDSCHNMYLIEETTFITTGELGPEAPLPCNGAALESVKCLHLKTSHANTLSNTKKHCYPAPQAL
jgi:hypothetical protein